MPALYFDFPKPDGLAHGFHHRAVGTQDLHGQFVKVGRLRTPFFGRGHGQFQPEGHFAAGIEHPDGLGFGGNGFLAVGVVERRDEQVAVLRLFRVVFGVHAHFQVGVAVIVVKVGLHHEIADVDGRRRQQVHIPENTG